MMRKRSVSDSTLQCLGSNFTGSRSSAGPGVVAMLVSPFGKVLTWNPGNPLQTSTRFWFLFALRSYDADHIRLERIVIIFNQAGARFARTSGGLNSHFYLRASVPAPQAGDPKFKGSGKL